MKLTDLLMAATMALMVSGALAAQGPTTTPQQPVGVAVPVDQPQPPHADQAQGGLQTRPLTEAEERERQIRLMDPRAPHTNDINTVPAVPGDEDRQTSQPSRQVTPDATSPLPGSVAAATVRRRNPDAAGPGVADSDDDSPDDYTGPAVLTRSYSLQTPELKHDLGFQYSFGASEIYDTASNLQTNRAGASRFANAFTWGLVGRHTWRKQALSFAYDGSWNHYSTFQGSNHSLQASYASALSRRLTFNLVVAGSIYSQGYSLENPVTDPTNSLADVNIAASPTVQIYDTTTRQVTVTPSLRWQKSARLSFNMSASGFAVDREGPQLIGQTGFQAQADVNYRLTRRVTVGAYYSATFYRYERDISVSDAHGTGALFSASLDRSTQIRLRGGISFFENQGLTLVTIDPAIAALLGYSTGIIDLYRNNKFTELSGELARDFHRNRTMTISYSRGLAPGNGLVLSSIQTLAGAGFNFRVRRQYTVSTGLGWSSLAGGFQITGTPSNYDSDYIYFGVSRPTGRRATTTLRADYRKFTITAANQTPNQLRITLGVNWASGDAPFRLW